MQLCLESMFTCLFGRKMRRNQRNFIRSNRPSCGREFFEVPVVF